MKRPIESWNYRGAKHPQCQFVRSLLFLSFSITIALSLSCSPVPKHSSFFKYESFVSNVDLSPRDSTPSVSSDTVTVLLKKGYIPIGSFEVKHASGMQTGMDTKEEALNLAATHGADMVILLSNNEPRDDVITKKGQCLETRSYSEVSWEPSGGAFGELRSVRECKKWAEVTERTKVIVTKGTAWRLEPDLVQQAGNAILLQAVNERDRKTVNELVRAGLADVNTRDRFGWTSLMLLSIDDQPDNPEIASFLVKNGARLDLRDPEGRTALMLSAMKENIAMFRLFIKFKADPSETDRHGKTALDLVPTSKRKEFEDSISNR